MPRFVRLWNCILFMFQFVCAFIIRKKPFNFKLLLHKSVDAKIISTDKLFGGRKAEIKWSQGITLYENIKQSVSLLIKPYIKNKLLDKYIYIYIKLPIWCRPTQGFFHHRMLLSKAKGLFQTPYKLDLAEHRLDWPVKIVILHWIRWIKCFYTFKLFCLLIETKHTWKSSSIINSEVCKFCDNTSYQLSW